MAEDDGISRGDLVTRFSGAQLAYSALLFVPTHFSYKYGPIFSENGQSFYLYNTEKESLFQ